MRLSTSLQTRQTPILNPSTDCLGHYLNDAERETDPQNPSRQGCLRLLPRRTIPTPREIMSTPPPVTLPNPRSFSPLKPSQRTNLEWVTRPNRDSSPEPQLQVRRPTIQIFLIRDFCVPTPTTSLEVSGSTRRSAEITRFRVTFFFTE